LILVTHDLDLANKTQRIINIKGGKIISDKATIFVQNNNN
jgi:putative ABC transport system ATP-binding protein